MALSNWERVGRALNLLLPEFYKFVEQELRDVYDKDWKKYLQPGDGEPDIQRLCNTMLDAWADVFEPLFDKEAKKVKGMVHDIRIWRNNAMHQQPLTNNETLNALIDIQRFLEVIQSPVAEDIERMSNEVMRSMVENGEKKEKRKAKQATLDIVVPGLRPWREVVIPHEDVAKGDFQQAEFAADLWQVYIGKGSDEYRDPRAFYSRTYLTNGLRELLINAIKRLSGQGGDPVVELKINFGGGKTHSMLALYHLFGGQAHASELAGVEDVLKAAQVEVAPVVKRAVIVGTVLRPGSPTKHEDGIETKTIWGEIAWQLAGKEGYELLREVDENATNPGDLMDKLFELTGPCLVLIDEWVAYARQLFERRSMLPAGDFDTQFTFAQTLCEAARRAKNVLVCVSIPASERDGVINATQAGDQAGKIALDRLQDAVGRSNMVWRPATNDESFEIVRRRLFQPIPDDMLAARDATINEFISLYQSNANEFPSECRESRYKDRMKASYPIHPELFDRLYTDWSTLEKFQRTRGVLRLMASVIHSLWINNDKSALIMPASIPLADPAVQVEVTRYLPENWSPVIDKDVDGPGSTPLEIDGKHPNIGLYLAARRVARTVFLGSAPLKGAANRGIDELRIKLGSAQPKEPIAIFGDALSKLRIRATYLYSDQNKYWYHTQASVIREAQERAARFKHEDVHNEIVNRLRNTLKGTRRGEFGAIHVDVPSSDIPDDRTLRLIIIGPAYQHKDKQISPALEKAKEIFEYRGSAPRSYRNRLVFAAINKDSYGELESAVREFLAWTQILEDASQKRLDLDNSNTASAEAGKQRTDKEVNVRLGAALGYILIPQKLDKSEPLEWQTIKISGELDRLAEIIVKKLESNDRLTRKLGPNILSDHINNIPLWREGKHVSVEQLQEDFAQYIYLDRLLDENVLYEAVKELTASNNAGGGFAYADSYDQETGSYVRLRQSTLFEGFQKPVGWLVKSSIADAIIDAELSNSSSQDNEVNATGNSTLSTDEYNNFIGAGQSPVKSHKGVKKRFHGSITLRLDDFRERAGDVSREVAAHLAKVVGSKVSIVIEISAEAENGYSEDILRTVNENCSTLKFDSFSFEEE